jgi:hypothetical protein
MRQPQRPYKIQGIRLNERGHNLRLKGSRENKRRRTLRTRNVCYFYNLVVGSLIRDLPLIILTFRARTAHTLFASSISQLCRAGTRRRQQCFVRWTFLLCSSSLGHKIEYWVLSSSIPLCHVKIFKHL